MHLVLLSKISREQRICASISQAPTFDRDVEEIGEEAAGMMKLTLHPHAHHDSSILALSTVVIQISKQSHLIYQSCSQRCTLLPRSNRYINRKKTSFSARSPSPPSSSLRSLLKSISMTCRNQISNFCSSERIRERKSCPGASRAGRR